MSAWIFYGAPLLWLLVAGVVLMIADAFFPTVPETISTAEQRVHRPELAMMTVAILVVGIGISVGLWISGVPAHAPRLFGQYLAVDHLSLVMDVVILLGAVFSVLLAGGYLHEHEIERGEFYPLILFTAFGAMILARATDLLSIFVGLETMSLGVYTLVAFRRTSPRAAEGALKYFLLGSFAAAILLFGSALLYGATGHTDLAGIGEAIKNQNADTMLVIFGVLLVIIGLAFKVSAVPFHMWTPDAYEGAITPVTTFMSVAVKAAAFAVLTRMLVVSFGDPLTSSAGTGWPPVLAGLAAVTMLFGNLGAVIQSSVKRMLAYSSIAHAGYILIALVAAQKLGAEAVSSVLYYLLAYTASNALAFGSLILMGSRGREAVSCEDLAGVGRRHPVAAVPFVVAMLSLMGFPPTGGFFAKYYVLNSAVQAGGGMVWLAVLGVLTSVLGAYYYLRVLVFMFMKEPKEGAPIAVPMKSGYVSAALVIAALFVMAMGLAPSLFLQMPLEAAQHLVQR